MFPYFDKNMDIIYTTTHMTEAPRPALKEVTSPQDGYARFMATKSREALSRPEMAGVQEWLEARVAALPEMTVTDTALTGKGGWGHEMTSDGHVKTVRGAFFEIPGQEITVTRPDGTSIGWTQPGIVQTETPITLPTREGEVTFSASGFVGVLTNGEKGEDARVLLSVGQEPFAKTEKKALVRTPLQTSAAKLSELLNGDKTKDPNLADVLEKVGKGKSVSEMFATGVVETFPLAPADPNRIDATNVGFVMKVADPEVQEALENEGANRWCTPDEVRALIKAGMVNGHTAAAFAVTGL